MRGFLDYINIFGKGHVREKATVAALAITAGLLGTLSIVLINATVNDGFAFDPLLMAAFVMVATSSVFTKRMAIRKMRAFLEDHIAELRLDLTSGIRNADFPFVEQLEKSEAVTRMTIDARRISRTGDVIIRTYYGAFTLVSSVVYLGWISPLAFVLLMGLFFIGISFTRIYNRYVARVMKKTATEEEVLFQGMEHLVMGIKELKLDRARNDDFFDNRLIPLAGRIRDLRKKALYRIQEGQLVLDALWLSFIGFFFVLNSDGAAGAQVLIVFLFMQGAMIDVIISVPFFIEANVAHRRIGQLQQDVDNRETGIPSSQIGKESPVFETLEVRDIRFDYTDKQGQPIYSFGPVSFDVKSGEITFIIGGNGGGKTTFLKLLLGLYPPLSGYFAVDGRKIRMDEHGHWFSAIFSDFHLFDGIYGVEAIDEGRLASLIDRMGLSSKTAWRGGRFSNTDLSTGQKKRLALVVAFMEDKSIYVFDEWAAEQDAEFRIEFYEQILPELKAKGKTVIVVSHDDRYFHCADHVIKLDYGRVSADGHM
uniref:Putative ATP-binding cassette transporter n=1 Tax=Candidatus Kentrum sp. FW TaxID=2126338 RepID=A0A450S125_9GAMM|nr:MAG: putative ATP-binding cassette transporter [Candidatus Kentron sp. FW]VFJ60862.1 MAG: putative ATP-binding cassette transporter [Candidatus Kentron sp. FW]